MKKRVIVAGHICLDINPVFSGPKVNAIGDLLKPGKLVQVGAAAFNTGGRYQPDSPMMQKTWLWSVADPHY